MQNRKSFKSYLFIFALLPIFIFGGCEKPLIKKELRIDIGAYFKDDVVTVKLDGREIFSGMVSTSPLSGVGEILVFDYPIGTHHLLVDVNGVRKSEVFRHKNDRFVYITFGRPPSTISISYPEEKYMYD